MVKLIRGYLIYFLVNVVGIILGLSIYDYYTHEKDLESNKQIAILLKEVPEIRENKPLPLKRVEELHPVRNEFYEREVTAVEEENFYYLTVNASAYCPCKLCCGKWSDGVTATGTSAWIRGVAVDPKVIPLGTKMFIPGYGLTIADDVGGAIKGDKIDVRFPTHEEAREFGRRTIRIRIYR